VLPDLRAAQNLHNDGGGAAIQAARVRFTTKSNDDGGAAMSLWIAKINNLTLKKQINIANRKKI
jgi:hypothetical protein